MYPFWEPVIEPLVRASGARRIVEIGALRGETTVKMLADLGDDAELHVIDPVPAFDPGEHERRFAGRYVFHRDLSLHVLPDAKPFDVALVDGDHNWYTVYNELRLLREASRREGLPLPVLVLHDVCWPYGRRDLYYAPEQIPEEFRQPYARRGMHPDRKKLLPGGGLNVGLANAEVEGGPRNGVMTALEDFLAEHDKPYRLLVLPIYFGLAIVVEHDRLAERPELAALLDDLETPAGKDRIIALSERIRLDAAVFEHNVGRVRDERLERANRRYLDLLRAALLDEHYLENEARIAYLLTCAARGAQPHAAALRDPGFTLRKELRQLAQARAAGGTADGPSDAYFPYTDMGTARLDQLDAALRAVKDDGVEGDLVECGTGRGGGAIYLRGFLDAYEVPDVQVWVADRFRASPEGGARPLEDGGVHDLLADLNQVRDGFARFGLFDDRVRFLQGSFRDTLPDAPIERIALLRVGATAASEASTILDALYDRVADGGYVLVEDRGDPEARAAVERFRAERGVTTPLEQGGAGAVAWRKTGDAVAVPAVEPAEGRARPPLVGPPPTDALDLSVVVVFYNMRREAARTLHSLSRTYQRGVDELDYEVIVVENGSAPDERLGEDYVRSFGPEFRYVDMGSGAPPSPVTALNRGIRAGRGQAFALMIDGAHVLTPGVLRNGVAGLRTYAPAVVATQQWYVGPGQQPARVEAGYDQVEEDALFERIAWPDDGYRLFEIGHFIGERDWFDGMWESNCLFVPRSLLEQVGAFDESFSMPGGGYANLELYERLGASPGVTVVSILGEGSFHQVHGGTTTNIGGDDDRRDRVFSYGEHYEALRGRPFQGPTKPIHYVGAFVGDIARRTRARRMTADAFGGRRIATGPDGLPERPEPMAEETRTTLVDAYWRQLGWRRQKWLGRRVNGAPTDLFVYQELLAELRPDWVVETGTLGGGRAHFLASVCDLLGHGRVVSVGNAAKDRLTAEHPRVTFVPGPPHEAPAFDAVRAVVGEAPKALVILGSMNGAARLTQEFAYYSTLVPVGSYVVVENTIVNGRPVWPGYGPGPGEAVRRIMAADGDFVQDSSWEKHGLTFHPGGFLRRVKGRPPADR